MAKCLFCNSDNIEEDIASSVVSWFCKVCGNVKIARPLWNAPARLFDDKWMLPYYFRKMKSHKKYDFILHHENIKEILEICRSERPKDLTDAINKTILYLGNTVNQIGGEITYFKDYRFDLVLHEEEFERIINILLDLDYIYGDFSTAKTKGSPVICLYIPPKFFFTPRGWDKFYSLKNKAKDSKNVFVAMWFGEKTTNLRKALRYVIETTGYNPIIVDESDFTGNIMEYVSTQIRESKFLIADLSCSNELDEYIKNQSSDVDLPDVKNGVRGGVYYEAGFAKGLGRQVIFTCCDDPESKRRIHFDLKQENMLYWKEDELGDKVRLTEERVKDPSPQNFSERLYDRIVYLFN